MEQMSEKDQMLWKQAKKRVGFKRHLFIYIIVNIFVWAMWLFRHDNWNMEMDVDMMHGQHEGRHYFFGGPIFMTLGWGIGLAFNFYSAYFGNNYSSVEKEFEKLKNSGK
ncbi:hypothetical protein BH09BAC5_BH09BAC5_04070 [soil metagenome]